jgi:hypothetical protein
MTDNPEDEVPVVSIAEAIAEVQRWLDVEKVDPEAIFTATGDHVVRYKDLIAHLERETPDGKLLRFAISRGRLMAPDRPHDRQPLLQIGLPPRPQEPA